MLRRGSVLASQVRAWSRPVVVGYPFAGGQGQDGVEQAPVSLLAGSNLGGARRQLVNLPEALRRSNRDPEEAHLPGARAFDRTVAASHALFDALNQKLAAKESVLTLGGDHSMALGSVAASLRHHPGVHVVWFDAHADINTPGESASGNVHGQPLAFLTRLEETARLAWLPDALPFRHIHYLGLRDVDAAEARVIQREGIDAMTATQVNETPMWVLKAHLDSTIPAGAPVHVSFDVDCLDPNIFPCTGTAVKGGLRLERALHLLTHLRDNHHLVNVDVTEVGNGDGGEGRTAAGAGPPPAHPPQGQPPPRQRRRHRGWEWGRR